jgi:hypothetical protein
MAICSWLLFSEANGLHLVFYNAAEFERLENGIRSRFSQRLVAFTAASIIAITFQHQDIFVLR